MRQVPEFGNTQTISPPSPLPSLILGNGRLAHHLHHYFHLIDFPHKHFDHSLRGELKSLPPEALAELDRKLLACPTIWILVSDSAIAEVRDRVIDRLRALGCDPSERILIHSSAATQVEGMRTIHPLMTFGEALYSRETYERIPLITFSGEDSSPRSPSPSLPLPQQNPHFTLPASRRALYHACAVMMSNFPILLWSEVTRLAKQELAADAAIFDPILKQTLENFTQLRERALTGPIARGDRATIEKNLAAIEGTPLFGLYHAFLETLTKEETR